MTLRKDLLDFVLTRVVVVACCILLTVGCFGQTVHQPTPNQEENLKKFLQNYLKDPLYGYKATRYLSAFVDLKGDGTQQVIVYFTDEQSCGSGGCTTLILTPKDSSYKVVTSIPIARPPIRVLASKSNGWHDIAVQVHGGGVMHAYEAKLQFNGKKYPSNPSVPPAQRLDKKVEGKVVIPLTRGGTALY
jgi:hypothetical protein